MCSYSPIISQIVTDFCLNGKLFTALDVSNEVKKQLPYARHKEVRDEVRALFKTDMPGYDRTPITVTLSDGSTTEALLYHPLSCPSNDLETQYYNQKAANNTAVNNVSNSNVQVPNNSISVTASSQQVTVTAAPNAKELWAQLFNSQPSLFPRR
jgi:hypothetical protein